MSVTAISSTPPATTTPAAAASNGANEERFLKLLTNQLNNQDPLNPMDNAQLTSQLAQMSTVSGIEKMNATLQSLVGQGSAGQLLQAGALVDHAVLAPGADLVAGNGPAAFAVELASPAQSVQVAIVDASGQPVRSIDLGALPVGATPQSWDGLDDAGEAVAPGVYHVAVVAANGSAKVAAKTLAYGEVASVTQAAGGLSLNLAGGGSVSLADIRMLR